VLLWQKLIVIRVAAFVLAWITHHSLQSGCMP
jgi:hypothetical protein